MFVAMDTVLLPAEGVGTLVILGPILSTANGADVLVLTYPVLLLGLVFDVLVRIVPVLFWEEVVVVFIVNETVVFTGCCSEGRPAIGGDSIVLFSGDVPVELATDGTWLLIGPMSSSDRGTHLAQQSPAGRWSASWLWQTGTSHSARLQSHWAQHSPGRRWGQL